jgi:hypothetical protein
MNEKEFVNEALNEAIPAVVESLKNELKKSLDYNVRENAQKLIAEYVTDWMKEHLLPEIGEMLVTMHEPLLKSSKVFAHKFIDVVAENLIEQVKKSMKDSWKRKKFFEALLD